MLKTKIGTAGTFALDSRLQAIRKFRSPVIGALLTLAILLGKALVCQHAPQRMVFFDAMLMVPISMFAYHEGLVTGLVAGLVASAADLAISARALEMTIPAYLAVSSVRTGVVAKLFSMEVLATVISALSCRSRRKALEAERQLEEYMRKIHLLEKHSEAIERHARHQQEEFEQDLLKYSSLVYMLEESAQKIYSNLEVDRLFQSLFRVLEECFGSTCASIYLKDSHKGSYFLASTSGGEGQVPMMLRPDHVHVAALESRRQPIYWAGEAGADESNGDGEQCPTVVSGMLLEKGEPIGIINIHAVDRDTSPDTRLMAMVCNIASIALANARLFGEVQWMAERDPLTKLYNRRTFHDQLESQIAARAATSEPFALLMLDIDHFKSFNDTYGHQAGDAVLEWFAGHCEECAGESNFVFRYGGEEFTIIMPAADGEAGVKLGEHVRTRIEKASFRYGETDLSVTLSCGVAVFPDHGGDGDELVRKADRAMYHAKGAGRNLVVITETARGHDTAIVPYAVKTATTARNGHDRPSEDAEDGDAGRRRHQNPVL